MCRKLGCTCRYVGIQRPEAVDAKSKSFVLDTGDSHVHADQVVHTAQLALSLPLFHVAPSTTSCQSLRRRKRSLWVRIVSSSGEI